MRKTLLLLAISLLAVQTVFAQEKVKRNQYGVAVKSDRLDVEAQDGILVFESPTSAYKLWFDTRIQADGAVFFGQDKDYDNIGNGVSIRRARFAIKGQINESWYGEFDMDLADGLIELKDAIVRYTGVPNLDLQVGNFKENFSLNRNTTSRYLQFMERPMVTSALAPSRLQELRKSAMFRTTTRTTAATPVTQSPVRLFSALFTRCRMPASISVWQDLTAGLLPA